MEDKGMNTSKEYNIFCIIKKGIIIEKEPSLYLTGFLTGIVFGKERTR